MRPPEGGGDEPVAEGEIRYVRRADVAIEDFGVRSLVLLCDSLQLREINWPSRRILAHLDRPRTATEVAALLAEEADQPADVLRKAVADALGEMEGQAVVQRQATWQAQEGTPMKPPRYLANPDVSYRPEDDDGGILFNPDTDALEVLNSTAAVIWSFLAAPRTPEEILAHLAGVCTGATREDMARDVAEFLEGLTDKGFVGIVEAEA